ncbi:hypothetical protein NLL32_00745 [Corynebacterium propinquum]|uniref:hypothetical protein n=1 Tax=Corynebacterium propinquum TaxID=43769 RepID=UPI0025435CEA|nr:hypothetical protein [Corynebacterium propinquum]MDK4252602.1 hypothetical protein [Corynebacterium propinquum]WKS49460.1 hypothetical protein NLL32_00745 [Corynebacterium propinquum]
MKVAVTYNTGKREETTVIHADKVRAELEAHRQGLPGLQDAPMTGITIQVWAAYRRMHAETPADFYQWLDDIENIEPIDAPIDEQTGAVVTEVNPLHTAAH